MSIAEPKSEARVWSQVKVAEPKSVVDELFEAGQEHSLQLSSLSLEVFIWVGPFFLYPWRDD